MTLVRMPLRQSAEAQDREGLEVSAQRSRSGSEVSLGRHGALSGTMGFGALNLYLGGYAFVGTTVFFVIPGFLINPAQALLHTKVPAYLLGFLRGSPHVQSI
jgi:hypothetical protein